MGSLFLLDPVTEAAESAALDPDNFLRAVFCLFVCLFVCLPFAVCL